MTQSDVVAKVVTQVGRNHNKVAYLMYKFTIVWLFPIYSQLPSANFKCCQVNLYLLRLKLPSNNNNNKSIHCSRLQAQTLIFAIPS